MSESLSRQIASLQTVGLAELREQFATLFGYRPTTGNKTWLIKRCAWRLQAIAEGDLSERARQRAEEMADDAELRLLPPRDAVVPTPPLPLRSESRLPPAGSVLIRNYKGRTLKVTVQADGFEYEQHHYRSLSAVAKAITGTHCNGFHFFKLNGGGL